jgi:alpha-beta hydrolase superfamily lysophospholipase
LRIVPLLVENTLRRGRHRGEYDGIATVDDRSDFFKRLPNGDRQFIILPGMAHSVVFGLNRQLFWHAMNAFLTMPKLAKG